MIFVFLLDSRRSQYESQQFVRDLEQVIDFSVWNVIYVKMK